MGKEIDEVAGEERLSSNDVSLLIVATFFPSLLMRKKGK